MDTMQDTPTIPSHKSVMTDQVLEYLNPQPDKVYIDVTFGVGGHTRAILEREPSCRVIAFDWDAKALEVYGQPLQDQFGDRLMLVWGNFAHLYKLIKKIDVTTVHGILADFGTSQVQIISSSGFSIYRDTPLDMRMSASHSRMTAADVIAGSSEEKLRELFWQLADEPKARAIAQAIVTERAVRPITTTGQLAKLIEKVVGGSRSWRIHPATKVFQALRIYVNQELENIHAFLAVTPSLLESGGRIVCISFHSLEDRIVKQFFKEKEQLQLFEILTDKVVVPTDQEVGANPSARSARLRAAQKR